MTDRGDDFSPELAPRYDDDHWRLFPLEDVVSSPMLGAGYFSPESPELNFPFNISPDLSSLPDSLDARFASFGPGDDFMLPPTSFSSFGTDSQPFASPLEFASAFPSVTSESNASYDEALNECLEETVVLGNTADREQWPPSTAFEASFSQDSQYIGAWAAQSYASSSTSDYPDEVGEAVGDAQTAVSTAVQFPFQAAPATSTLGPPSTAFNIIVCQSNRSSAGFQSAAAIIAARKQRKRGRSGPLTEAGREEAALIRKLSACGNCKHRKTKCGPGAPCQPCVQFFKTALVRHPCRGNSYLPDLLEVFLSSTYLIWWCLST